MPLIIRTKSKTPAAPTPATAPATFARTAPTPAPQPAPKPSAKIVLRTPAPTSVMGRTPPKPAAKFVVGQKLSDDQQAALVEAGIVDVMKKKYSDVNRSDRVVITNNKFPWVQHYKPGDKGVVVDIRYAKDPIGLDDSNAYDMFLIELDKDSAAKGGRCFLFRWEFEKLTELYTETPKGKVVGGLK